MDKQYFRFDYIVIWANGLAHEQEILDLLGSEEKLEVLETERITIPDMREFVMALYALDSVPFKFLDEKVGYLVKEKPEALFVYVRHFQPDEYGFENEWGWFIRSNYIHLLKERIRDTHNPYVGGKRTMENVVHASDHELQLDHTLRLLGHEDGIEYLYGKYGRSVRERPEEYDFSRYAPRFKPGFIPPEQER